MYFTNDYSEQATKYLKEGLLCEKIQISPYHLISLLQRAGSTLHAMFVYMRTQPQGNAPL